MQLCLHLRISQNRIIILEALPPFLFLSPYYVYFTFHCNETLVIVHTSIKNARTAPNITRPHMYKVAKESVNRKPYSLAAMLVPVNIMRFELKNNSYLFIQEVSDFKLREINGLHIPSTKWKLNAILGQYNVTTCHWKNQADVFLCLYQSYFWHWPSIITARGRSATVIHGWIW